MQVYLVGGAVRDRLLNRPIKDKDFVVVGTTPAAMLTAGFIQVGADFPVFLHPITKAEYALARTERKSGKGYKGFAVYAAPEVSLEQDLQRRDLTINAMAIEVHGLFDDTPLTGQVVDPYGGLTDLKNKVLRHVSAAFSEDPLRVLRIARFYGRFYDPNNKNSDDQFHIAADTLTLITKIIAAGELQQLTAERVWQETARAMIQTSPQAYFECLLAVGALPHLMPALAIALAPPPVQALTFKALAIAGQQNATLYQRWALLMSSFAPDNLSTAIVPDTTVSTTAMPPIVSANLTFPNHEAWLSSIKQLGNLLKAPKKVTQFASLYANTYDYFVNFADLSASDFAVMIQITKANKDAGDMNDLITTHHQLMSAYQQIKLEQLITAYNSITMSDIDSDLQGSAIGAALDDVRVAAIATALTT